MSMRISPGESVEESIMAKAISYEEQDDAKQSGEATPAAGFS